MQNSVWKIKNRLLIRRQCESEICIKKVCYQFDYFDNAYADGDYDDDVDDDYDEVEGENC